MQDQSTDQKPFVYGAPFSQETQMCAQSVPVYEQPPQTLWTCKFCRFVGLPTRTTEMSPYAWVVALFLLPLCALLFWIPLVIMKRDVAVCPRCGHRHL
jgi:hypothetical protein